MLSKHLFGYFDPEMMYLDEKMNNFQAKTEALAASVLAIGRNIGQVAPKTMCVHYAHNAFLGTEYGMTSKYHNTRVCHC